MDDESPSRRRFLAASLTGAGLALGGCLRFESADESTTVAGTGTEPTGDGSTTDPDVATGTPTLTPAAALTPTDTRTPAGTSTPASTDTRTSTPTPTDTQTSTPTPTDTQTPTPTQTPTSTPTPEPYSQSDKIAADDGDEDDYFGSAVAVDGNTVLVGAYRDADNGDYSGSAYVFTAGADGWRQTAKLLPEDGDRQDRFGYAVALDGDTALVGAQHDDDPNGLTGGSAYVFERSDGEWTETAKLSADDGDDGDNFGTAVALDGDTAVVGAMGDEDPNGDNGGSAYVFDGSGDGWTQAAKLSADDGDGGDRFGYAVDVSGGTAVVGAFRDDDPSSSAGSAYVFERPDGDWSQAAKLSPDDAGNDARFGNAVAVDRDAALVSAWQESVSGGSGAVYAFEHVDGAWTRTGKLSPPLADSFGVDVSLDGETAVASDGSQTAHVYGGADGEWSRRSTLSAGDGDRYDNFGASLDIAGDTIVVGARGDEDPNGGGNFNGAGSAYVFEQ